MERWNTSWIWGDGDIYENPERTILDAADQWVARHAEEHPGLKAALADGALMKRARTLTFDWVRASEERVNELRRSDGIRKDLSSSHLQRTAVAVVRAFVTRHSTFSTFLSEPLDGLQRWQSALQRACIAPQHACFSFSSLF